MSDKIPISVIIATRAAADILPRCLNALHPFDEIIIVDTLNGDDTAAIAARYGTNYVSFTWDGGYPKKRQWCLDHLTLSHERIFFVDVDEVVTPELAQEVAGLDWSCAGYFIRGRYIWDEQPLRHGLMNNKLALLDRRRVRFPVVDDLDIAGMGEIEGHYQPVLVNADDKVGQVRTPLLHYAGEEGAQWIARHEGYAQWEAQMIMRDAYPREPDAIRTILKNIFRVAPCRPALAFVHSYIVKGGFLDGARGFKFARSRYRYYRMVSRALSSANKGSVSPTEAHTSHFAP